MFSGDGHGKLQAPRALPLPGRVTALTAGEVNRADGLPDLVVGASTSDGFQVLVYESPGGAVNARAEVFPVAAEVTTVAVGRVLGGVESDITVGTGQEVVVIRGRDRRLSVSSATRIPAAIDRYVLSSPVRALAIGMFGDQARSKLAVLSEDGAVRVLETGPNLEVPRWRLHTVRGGAALMPAKVSDGRHDDLIVIDDVDPEVHILGDHRAAVRLDNGRIVAVLPMRLNADALSDLVLLRSDKLAPEVMLSAPANTFVVNSSGDGSDCDLTDNICSTGSGFDGNGKCILTGICPLRAALEQASASPGLNEVTFQVSTASVGGPGGTMSISGPMIVDGTTAPGGRVEIPGNTLRGVTSPFIESSTIRGLVLNWDSSSIPIARPDELIRLGSNNILQGNFIGTDRTGTLAVGSNVGTQIEVRGDGNVIGGTSITARNVLSGNLSGNAFSLLGNNNIVQGNYIGRDVTGNAPLGTGGSVAGTGNMIGGTAPGARNVIGSLEVVGSGNLIQGNYVGTDASGKSALGGGLSVFSEPSLFLGNNNMIGGPSPGAGNVVSGGSGIVLSDFFFGGGNLIQGNI